MTLSARGVYALRCAALMLGGMSVALVGVPDLTDRPLLLAAIAGGLLALGFGLFFGDYRARRGRRTLLGSHVERFARKHGLIMAVPTLIPLLDALRTGRTPSSFSLLAIPTFFLIGLSLSGLLVPWPWSEPAKPMR